MNKLLFSHTGLPRQNVERGFGSCFVTHMFKLNSSMTNMNAPLALS